MNFLIVCAFVFSFLSFSTCLPDDCTCRLGAMPRIVKGKDSELVPFLVSVRVNGEHKCSGLILNDQHVLTIESCISGHETKELQVVAGITRLDEETENRFNVKSISLSGTNDIINSAVLKLETKFVFEKLKIERACLRMYDASYKGFFKTLLTAGWGFDEPFELDKDGNMNKEIRPTNRLKKANVKYDSQKTTEKKIRVKPRWFSRVSTCAFDEGSPLMYENNGRVYVVGFSDDMLLADKKRRPGEYLVCNGVGSFIKPSALQDDGFLNNFNTSTMCLEREG